MEKCLKSIQKAEEGNVNHGTQVIHHYVASKLLPLVHSKLTKHSNYTPYFTNFIECALCKVQFVGKAETAFSIRLNNYRKDVNSPKSIPVELHIRKPGHSFNLHAKFTLIEQLSNIHTADKETLKLRLKRCEDFWIQNLETLRTKGLNQELNIV